MPVIGGWTRVLANWWGVDPDEPKPRIAEIYRILGSLEAVGEARTRLGDTVVVSADVGLWDAQCAWQQCRNLGEDLALTYPQMCAKLAAGAW